MIAFVFLPCVTIKVSAWHMLHLYNYIYIYPQFCPTTPTNIPPSALHPRSRGETALHRAAESGHAAVIEQLISAGAKVDAAAHNGHGPGRVLELL